jgi:hypothetical protein
MRSMRPGSALGSLALAAAAVGAAAAIAFGSGQGSGIEGRVVPCGIVLERPAPCAATANRRAGKVLIGQHDRVVRHAKLQADGSFRAPLDAGRYWLETRINGDRGPRIRTTVSGGEWTSVTLIAGRVAPPRRP